MTTFKLQRRWSGEISAENFQQKYRLITTVTAQWGKGKELGLGCFPVDLRDRLSPPGTPRRCE